MHFRRIIGTERTERDGTHGCQRLGPRSATSWYPNAVEVIADNVDCRTSMISLRKGC